MIAPDLNLMATVATTYACRGREALLPALRDTQAIYGYVPQGAARQVAATLGVPLADVYGVIEFYALLYERPVGKTLIHVCNDPVCSLAGSESVLKRTKKSCRGRDSGSITIERAPCLGLCAHAPAVLVQGAPASGTDIHSWRDLADADLKHPETHVAGDIAILTENCRHGGTTWLAAYESRGGYDGLRQALKMAPAAVVRAIKEAGLAGRGGAAFSTGVKLDATANAPGDVKYVVCNGDEAEPGAFKDRILMENDPHRVLEGILIAAYAVGATKGYFYIRGEYNYGFGVVSKAIDEARQAGILGTSLPRSGFTFDIEMRQGAGAYICGEETALLESIEGKRGFARVKPPFPVTHGLFGKPTAVNNVETLCNLPYILRAGAAAYRQFGTAQSPGSKLFCVAGDVVQPGLYEVGHGGSLGYLLFDLAGGIRDGRNLRAALVGGAAGSFATAEHLDVGLSFEQLREAGLTLGAGVVTVFDETRDMLDISLRLAQFFADESCGKCYPCQIGTQRQLEIVKRARERNPLPGDLERLRDVGRTMTDSSLCGLGQTAGLAVLSASNLWPHLFEPGNQP